MFVYADSLSSQGLLLDNNFRALIRKSAVGDISPEALRTLKNYPLTPEQKEEVTQAVIGQVREVLEVRGIDTNVDKDLPPKDLLNELISRVKTAEEYPRALIRELGEVVGADNVASGTWPRDYEEELHKEFKDFFNDPEAQWNFDLN